MYKRLCTGKFSGQGLFARDCEGTEPLQIINEIGVDIYPVGVYYKDSEEIGGDHEAIYSNRHELRGMQQPG